MSYNPTIKKLINPTNRLLLLMGSTDIETPPPPIPKALEDNDGDLLQDNDGNFLTDNGW